MLIHCFLQHVPLQIEIVRVSKASQHICTLCFKSHQGSYALPLSGQMFWCCRSEMKMASTAQLLHTNAWAQPLNHMLSWQVAQGIRRDSFLTDSKDPYPKDLNFLSELFLSMGSSPAPLKPFRLAHKAREGFQACFHFWRFKPAVLPLFFHRREAKADSRGQRMRSKGEHYCSSILEPLLKDKELSWAPSCRGARSNFSFKT